MKLVRENHYTRGEGGYAENSMNDFDKKQYIKNSWKVSSGNKITEMLLRYWDLKNPPKIATIEDAQELFYE